MDLHWKLLELLLLLSSAAAFSKYVGDYISSLARYLADQEPGTFDCWFYENTESTDASILNHIIAANRDAMIPQRILRNAGRIEIQRSPALVIINYFSENFDKIINFLLTNFDRLTKFVVILDPSIDLELSNVMLLFAHFSLHDVIYVRFDSLQIYQKMAFQEEGFSISAPVPFPDLFIDPVGNLTGHTFHASHAVTTAETFDFNIKSTNDVGYNELLFNDVIHRFGGRVQYHAVRCKETESPDECRNKVYWYNSTLMYDFSTKAFTLLTVANDIFMASVVPNAMIIAVPRGRRFTTFEVFTIPFRRELWFGLLAFLIASVLMMILQPTLITNNLILHPICGFERREFHRVSPLEKTILITLIVIFFILLSAYEAKIIAFMTEFPHLPDPRTIDDLIQNNITIQQYGDSWGSEMFEVDPRIKQLFAQSYSLTPSQIQWDSLNHAIIGGRSYMNVVLSHPKNYDPVSGRRRFTILQDFTLGIRVTYFFCSLRHPLAPKIQRYETWRFESGLYDFWVREQTRTVFGIRQSRNLYRDRVDVGFTELEPAWYALGIGLTVGSVTLVLEIICKGVISKYRKTRITIRQGFTRFTRKVGNAS